MDVKQAIHTNIALLDMIIGQYLGDLTDAELMARPVPGANHIAWQLGHLIAADRAIYEKGLPGQMDPLPAGFAEAHSKATAAIDDPAKFLKKAEYLELAAKVRKNAMTLLEGLSPEDLDRPVGNIIPVVKTVGDLYVFTTGHWLMHTGQWAMVRRSLGKPPLF